MPSLPIIPAWGIPLFRPGHTLSIAVFAQPDLPTPPAVALCSTDNLVQLFTQIREPIRFDVDLTEAVACVIG